MNINFKEASTKRGIVMTVTGFIALYQMIFGQGVTDIDALLARVEWWLGMGLTAVGLLGFLPDEPPRNPLERTRETDPTLIPPVDLQGRSEPESIPPDLRLRIELPPGHRTQAGLDERGSAHEWHGFNDQ